MGHMEGDFDGESSCFDREKCGAADERTVATSSSHDDLLRFSTSRSKSKKKRVMHVHHRSNQSISIKEEVEQNGRENGEESAMETHGGVF